MNHRGNPGVRNSLNDAAVNRLAALLLSYRLAAKLSIYDVERLSNVGHRTISTFETGRRTATISFAQLLALLNVYGVTLFRLETDLLSDVRRVA